MASPITNCVEQMLTHTSLGLFEKREGEAGSDGLIFLLRQLPYLSSCPINTISEMITLGSWILRRLFPCTGVHPGNEKEERDTNAAAWANAAISARLWGLGAATAWAAIVTPDLDPLHLHHCQTFPSRSYNSSINVGGYRGQLWGVCLTGRAHTIYQTSARKAEKKYLTFLLPIVGNRFILQTFWSHYLIYSSQNLLSGCC